MPTGIIALVGLLWGSSRFYAALDYAFTRIFLDGRKRNEIERTVRGVIVTLPRWWQSRSGGCAEPGDRLARLGGARPLAGVLRHDPLAPGRARSCCSSPATVLVYRYVPAKHVPWRALVLPALLAGVILAGFTQLYALFAPLLTKMAAIYGTFVAFFAILAWLSISFNVLLFGACWTRVREQGLPEPEPEPTDEGAGEPAATTPAE